MLRGTQDGDSKTHSVGAAALDRDLAVVQDAQGFHSHVYGAGCAAGTSVGIATTLAAFAAQGDPRRCGSAGRRGADAEPERGADARVWRFRARSGHVDRRVETAQDGYLKL